jgi:hypothetical protein
LLNFNSFTPFFATVHWNKRLFTYPWLLCKCAFVQLDKTDVLCWSFAALVIKQLFLFLYAALLHFSIRTWFLRTVLDTPVILSGQFSVYLQYLLACLMYRLCAVMCSYLITFLSCLPFCVCLTIYLTKYKKIHFIGL